MPHRSPFVRLSLVALLGLAAPASAQCPVESGGPASPGTRTYYGSFMDSDGQRVVVGEGQWSGRRRANVYARSGTSWARVAVLDGGRANFVGGAPVAISGPTVMIGDVERDNEAGRVFVHEESGGVFQQVQVLTPSTRVAQSHFGRRIAVDGDRAVVAAPMDGTNAVRGGALFVFERIGGTWAQTARIDPPTAQPYAFFGIGLDLDGDTIVASRPGIVTTGTTGYTTLVYRETGGAWVLEAELGAGRSGPELLGFGYDVALDGDRIAVGSYRDVVPGRSPGAVHVFERSGGTWSAGPVLSSASVPGLEPMGSFGKQVELDGDRLLVSGNGMEVGGTTSVRALIRTAAGYEAAGAIEPPSHSASFGAAIALAGGDIWVGAPYFDDPVAGDGGTTGTHHVYDLDRITAFCKPPARNSTGQLGRLEAFGCGTLDANDLVLLASALPPHSPAVAVAGNASMPVPGIFGGAGVLCVSGQTGRLGLKATDERGRAKFPVDYFTLPGGAPPMAGQTWFLQCVHRDGATSNTTNGVAVRLR